MLMVSVMSCTNSKQPATEQQTMAEDTTYILPSPNMDLVLYAKEDIGNATNKIKKAFNLNGEPVKSDDWHNIIQHDYKIGYHYYYNVKTPKFKIEYHINSAYGEDYKHHPNWFDDLVISFNSDIPTAFDDLQALTDSLNGEYKNSTNFEWDDERQQWTNGNQFVYIQSPTRDEETGNVYAAICIMPIEKVQK